MSYNVVFLYIKDFWLNFIFETLDDKKNNQKIDQKHKRRFQVSQFLSENSNSLIVGTSVSYNVVFLYIKDFWLNFIFETLDDKKNNQKIDQKHKRRFQVSQFLSENSNSLIVGTSVKFWSKIYNILRYIKKSVFSKFYEIWGVFLMKNSKNSQ